jgi:hypothetical protein
MGNDVEEHVVHTEGEFYVSGLQGVRSESELAEDFYNGGYSRHLPMNDHRNLSLRLWYFFDLLLRLGL